LAVKTPRRPFRQTRWGSVFVLRIVAEGEGFEPPEACTSAVFKTAAYRIIVTLASTNEGTVAYRCVA
jgi:hypothetical protein